MRAFPPILFVIVISAFCLTSVNADLAVAPQILAPKTPAEAWNVIRLSTANVARLIEEKRLYEVATQISLCSPALRTLASSYTAPENSKLLNDSTGQAASIINNIARTGMAEQLTATASEFTKLRALLDKLKPAFDPAAVAAEIYTCPQHPEEVTPDSSKPCPQCQKPLRVRRIPYSDIYAIPGKPSAVLSVRAKSELTAGSANELSIHLKTPTGEPLKASDLIVMHNAAVRLLVVDPSLTDFQSIAPITTEQPGEWTCPFTPATAGPYRVWAHITPVATALPEELSADLGSDFAIIPRVGDSGADMLSATAGGLKFQIAFGGGTGGPPPAKQTRMALIKITDDKDQPITTLQPLNLAFAHLTGIYADGQTLLQLHPAGGDILSETSRGGPMLNFKTYLPKPGYVRIFCQIKLNDQVISVPFGINVKSESGL